VTVACVRTAWLTLGSSTVPLEDPTRGYFCSSLDLGYPTVREVTSPRPDQNGEDDRTSLFGARAVTVNITAVAGAGAVIDDVADNFAPFMDPSQRPVLHYVLDRPGTPERVLTVRASGYSWPVAGPYQRDIQLGFVAADPVARATTATTVTCWAGTASPGRAYNLGYNRAYPAGTSATTATMTVTGDVTARPLIRIYGSLTAPRVDFAPAGGGATQWFYVHFAPSFAVNAGDWVDVDCANRTAFYNSDTTRPVLTNLDWVNSKLWPAVAAGQTYTVTCAGTNANTVSQAQMTWTEGYLT
jgi:hypothetical protein